MTITQQQAKNAPHKRIDIDRIKEDANCPHVLIDLLPEIPFTEKGNRYVTAHSGVKITCKNGNWRLENHSGRYGDFPRISDAFQIAAYQNNLTLEGYDYIKVAKIVAKAANSELTFSDSDENTAHKTRAVQPVKKKFTPNEGQILNPSYINVRFANYDSEIWESTKDYFSPLGGINEAFLKYYKVRPLLQIVHKDKGYKTIFNKEKFAFAWTVKDVGHTICAKNPTNKDFKDITIQWSGDYVFGWEQLPRDLIDITLIIAEGEKDTLVLNWLLNRFGVYAICRRGVKDSLDIDFTKDLQSRFKAVYTLFDNDVAGEEGTGKALSKNGIEPILLEKYVPRFDSKEYIKDNDNDVADIVKNRSAQFLVNLVLKEIGVPRKYILKEDEFIGDMVDVFQIVTGINKLIGGTGTGKTNYVANNFDKIIVVSNNITTLENYNKYGFNRFVMSEWDSTIWNWDKITVTTKSWSNLKKGLVRKGILENYVICYDEFHGLVESYEATRHDTELFYYDLCKLQKTNRIILSSANDVSLSHPGLIAKNEVIFSKPSTRRRVTVSYDAKEPQLLKKIWERLQEGKKVLLYTNRKEDKAISQAIKNEFGNKYSIQFFDATKHKGDKKISLSQLTKDITVCTKAVVTGKDIDTPNVAAMVYCDDYDMKRSTVNQFFGRPRDFKTASFDLLFSFKSNNQDNTEVNEKSLSQSLIGLSKSIIKSSTTDIAFLHENENYLAKKDTNGYLSVNYSQIDNIVESRKSKATLRNTNLLKSFLEGHGFNVEFSETPEVEVLNDLPKESKESKNDKYLKEIDLIQSDDVEGHELETTAKDRIDILQKIGLKKDRSVEIAKENNSSLKWKRYTSLLASQKRLTEKNDKQYKKDYSRFFAVSENGYLSSFDFLFNLAKTPIRSCTVLGRLHLTLKENDINDRIFQNKTIKELKKHFSIETKHTKNGREYKFYNCEEIESIIDAITENDLKEMFSLSRVEI